jgi:hypothetical protein
MIVSESATGITVGDDFINPADSDSLGLSEGLFDIYTLFGGVVTANDHDLP